MAVDPMSTAIPAELIRSPSECVRTRSAAQ